MRYPSMASRPRYPRECGPRPSRDVTLHWPIYKVPNLEKALGASVATSGTIPRVSFPLPPWSSYSCHIASPSCSQKGFWDPTPLPDSNCVTLQGVDQSCGPVFNPGVQRGRSHSILSQSCSILATPPIPKSMGPLLPLPWPRSLSASSWDRAGKTPTAAS